MTWTPPKPEWYERKGFLFDPDNIDPASISCEKLYTLAQLEAVRREAIEECAKVCEEHAEYPSLTPQHCADAIRELLEQT